MTRLWGNGDAWDDCPHVSLADLGMTVTIAMAAVSGDYIVTVADKLISFGDVVQPSDNILKARGISNGWGMMFAANNANLFIPFNHIVIRALSDGRNTRYSVDQVKAVCVNAYQEMFNAEFSAQVLSRYRFDDISDFRKNGLAELGERNFASLLAQLHEFDLGISVIVFGHDEIGAHVFQIANPGVVIDNDILGISVIGSGRFIAMGSLMARGAIKPSDLPTTIYRLLEAKFSAESASGVGRGTTCFTHHKDDILGALPAGHIEKVREIWQAQQKLPLPSDALSIIREHHFERRNPGSPEDVPHPGAVQGAVSDAPSSGDNGSKSALKGGA
jgi:hypothetical protein